MGPVSFERMGDGLDRDRLLALARRLTAAGIRVQLVDGDGAILVRGEDATQARHILSELEPE